MAPNFSITINLFSGIHMSYDPSRAVGYNLTTDIIERIDYLRFLLVKAEAVDPTDHRQYREQPDHLRGLIAGLLAELSRRNVVNS